MASDFRTEWDKEEGSDILAVIRFEKSGTVDTRVCPHPDWEAPEEEWNGWNECCDVVSFLMYALSRPEWVDDWRRHERALLEKFNENKALEEKAAKRSHLKLIPGGVDNDTKED